MREEARKCSESEISPGTWASGHMAERGDLDDRYMMSDLEDIAEINIEKDSEASQEDDITEINIERHNASKYSQDEVEPSGRHCEDSSLAPIKAGMPPLEPRSTAGREAYNWIGKDVSDDESDAECRQLPRAGCRTKLERTETACPDSAMSVDSFQSDSSKMSQFVSCQSCLRPSYNLEDSDAQFNIIAWISAIIQMRLPQISREQIDKTLESNYAAVQGFIEGKGHWRRRLLFFCNVGAGLQKSDKAIPSQSSSAASSMSPRTGTASVGKVGAEKLHASEEVRESVCHRKIYTYKIHAFVYLYFYATLKSARVPDFEHGQGEGERKNEREGGRERENTRDSARTHRHN